jgi:hypothetical protein
MVLLQEQSSLALARNQAVAPHQDVWRHKCTSKGTCRNRSQTPSFKAQEPAGDSAAQKGTGKCHNSILALMHVDEKQP